MACLWCLGPQPEDWKLGGLKPLAGWTEAGGFLFQAGHAYGRRVGAGSWQRSHILPVWASRQAAWVAPGYGSWLPPAWAIQKTARWKHRVFYDPAPEVTH